MDHRNCHCSTTRKQTPLLECTKRKNLQLRQAELVATIERINSHTTKIPEPKVLATLRMPRLVRTCVHGVGSSRVSSEKPPLPSFSRQPSPPHAFAVRSLHQFRNRPIEPSQTKWSCPSFFLTSPTSLFFHISFVETQALNRKRRRYNRAESITLAGNTCHSLKLKTPNVSMWSLCD